MILFFESSNLQPLIQTVCVSCNQKHFFIKFCINCLFFLTELIKLQIKTNYSTVTCFEESQMFNLT